MKLISTYYKSYIILALIIVACSFFQYQKINEFPQFKHCWAQCDRYALALGFINNGGDFFHPETFIYNNQFPTGDFNTIRSTTITSVDFPIHDYCVSLLMRLFGTTSPWCFRLYILVYSMIGLFFLYRLVSLFTDSVIKPIAIILFAISSPVFLYYQAGFLPTIPSLANSLIGLYFLFTYYQNGKKSKYLLAIFFVTLAVLTRLPFAIILTAIICMEFLEILKSKKVKLFKVVAICSSILCVSVYYLYNSHLRELYGSLFLNYIIPAKNWPDLVEFFTTTIDRWFFKYFTAFHYILFLMCGLVMLVLVLLKKITLSPLEKKLVQITSIVLLGAILYYFIMTFQFLDHDYYFLDTFYLPIVGLFAFFIIKMPDSTSKIWNVFFTIILVGSSFVLLAKARNTLAFEKEQIVNAIGCSTAQSFVDSDKLLDSLHISKTDKLLVIASDGPNNPFILMKRKGFTVIFSEKEKIANALLWPFNYVVIENEKMINMVYPAYSNILNELEKIGGNNTISVFKRKANKKTTNFDDFFSLNQKSIVFSQEVSFDSVPQNFSVIDSLSSFCYSGRKSGFLKTSEFGFSLKFTPKNLITTKTSILKFEAMVSSKAVLKECLICLSIKDKDQDLAFLVVDLANFDQSKLWNKNEVLFTIPKFANTNYEINVLVWNKGKNAIFCDDLKVTVCQ